MKKQGYYLSVLLSAVVVVVGCGQEAPKTSAPSTPAAESAGQAVVDSIKAPLDKARAVEGTLRQLRLLPIRHFA